MANKRQKKKKNAAAARQAAANYKGKNAPVKAAAQVKKPDIQPKQEEIKKPQPQAVASANKPTKPEQAKTPKKEPVKTKKAEPKKKTVKKNKPDFLKKLALSIRAFGVNKLAAIILVVCVAIAAVCIGVRVSSARFSVPKETIIDYSGRNIPDSSTYYVETDLANQYEFADAMPSKGDKKEFRYYAATQMLFEEKYSKASLNLVNVFDNNCVLVASIVDENDNVVYRSLGLEAGKGLDKISIDLLKYGTHEMKLVVAAYDPETYDFIGVQYSDLTVQVGIEEETANEESQSSED